MYNVKAVKTVHGSTKGWPKK